MNKQVAVTMKMSKADNATVRNYCAYFDETMSEVLVKLVLWAMDNAPVKRNPFIDLGEIGQLQMKNDGPRTLRGAKPKAN